MLTTTSSVYKEYVYNSFVYKGWGLQHRMYMKDCLQHLFIKDYVYNT